MEEKLVGKITHYYGNIGVAVVALSGDLRASDTIHLKGKSTDITQQVSSMQIEHQSLEMAKAGQEIGMKVDGKVREGDEVFLVVP